MSYNKTVLYDSNGTRVTSCTLSESAANFKTLRFIVNENNFSEIESFTNGTRICMFQASGGYTQEVYIHKVLAATIDSAGTGLTISRFNIIGSRFASGTPSNGVAYWGSSINPSNNKSVRLVIEGIDRINYVEEAGAGSPGQGWKKYNETELWTGSNSSTITLSESASNFERLRVLAGTDSPIWNEVDAPSADGDKITVESINTESDSIFSWGFSLWTWSNGMTTLTSSYGKSFRNTGTNAGSTTGTLDNSDTTFNKRPILKVVGVNRR